MRRARAESSVTWSISIDWMLHPTELADGGDLGHHAGDGRGTGMRTSSMPLGRTAPTRPAARGGHRPPRRAGWFNMETRSSPRQARRANCPQDAAASRRKPPKEPQRSCRRRCRVHSSAEPAAMRVESLNPPAANRMSESLALGVTHGRQACTNGELAAKMRHVADHRHRRDRAVRAAGEITRAPMTGRSAHAGAWSARRAHRFPDRGTRSSTRPWNRLGASALRCRSSRSRHIGMSRERSSAA